MNRLTLAALAAAVSLTGVTAAQARDHRYDRGDYGRHDDGRYGRHDNGNHYGWDHNRHGDWREHHRGHRYSYYRHGQTYYGWR